MTGECGNLVRELGFEDHMIEEKYPVKHGVVVSGTKGNPDWWLPMSKRNPDLTADLNPTWQVRRSKFDKVLLDTALARGAELISGKATVPLVDNGRVLGAEVELANGETLQIEAKITLDCSGQATFLANRKATGPKYMGSYDKQIAIFSHIKNFVRDEDTDKPDVKSTNTHIFYTRKYHWAWGIPIDHEVQSVGIVVPAAYFRDKHESKRDFYVRELRELNPGLARRVEDAELVEDVHIIPNYSFQVAGFTGPGYICVGDSHRFVDPIFSFGLFVAIQESKVAVDAAVDYLAAGGVAAGKGKNPFIDYMVGVEKGIDVLEDMIDTFWENHWHSPLWSTTSTGSRCSMCSPDGSTRECCTRAAMRRWSRSASFSNASAPTTIKPSSRSRSDPDITPSELELWNSELSSVEGTERWIPTTRRRATREADE